MNSSGKDTRDKVTSLLPMLPICPRLSLKMLLMQGLWDNKPSNLGDCQQQTVENEGDGGS